MVIDIWFQVCVFHDFTHMCTLLQSNASYGMGVAPDIWETFLELQMKKAFSYVIFKIEERQPQVVVKMTGDTINSYDDFIPTLLENDYRCALYDFDFVTGECAEKQDFLHCLVSFIVTYLLCNSISQYLE